MDIKKIPIIGAIVSTIDGYGIQSGPVFVVLGIIIFVFSLQTMHVSQSKVISFMFLLAPLWLPYVTFFFFFEKWTEMVGKKFTVNSGRAVLEIILPPEVTKSPEAMDIVISQLYNAANPDNYMDTYIDGKRPLPYTFEIVSRGGDIHFYITVPEKNANAVMDNLYAQYPGVEVKKLDLDYTAEVPNSLQGFTLMSFHFGKKKDAVFPIKTYIDFGLDRMPKEEEKIDPMTPMLEVLGGIKPHQQVWVQLLCTAHRDKSFKNGQLTNKGTWEKDIEAAINKIMQRDPKTKTGAAELEGQARLTQGERALVENMERQAGKYAYNFAARFMYISNRENDFDGALFGRIGRTLSATEVKGGNGLGIRWRTGFDYPKLADPSGRKVEALKKAELNEYKQRKLNEKAFSGIWKVMSSEEIATIFHLPGTVARTPTLNRVGSTRGEAPANLPIGNIQ